MLVYIVTQPKQMQFPSEYFGEKMRKIAMVNAGETTIKNNYLFTMVGNFFFRLRTGWYLMVKAITSNNTEAKSVVGNFLYIFKSAMANSKFLFHCSVSSNYLQQFCPRLIFIAKQNGKCKTFFYL